jgi:hypothetical protein
MKPLSHEGASGEKTMIRKKSILIVTLLVMALLPVSALAGETSSGGVTLFFPDNMVACEPTFAISTTGVDPSWGVVWTLFKSESGVLVEIARGFTTGNLDLSVTPATLATGESKVFLINVAVFVPDQATIKLSGKWRVDCEAPPDGEGCTPGFWKTHPDVWPIPTDSDFDTIFGRDAFNPDITMLGAVDLKGGHIKALSRHAAAAYLNAIDGAVNFDLTTGEVIGYFQSAFDSGDYNTTKNMFEELNELGCPY